ncbi:ComF family protein [Alistipes putredinis]|uniref:ComF family protein n=1 Tax=Alistipes putredinis TaxID=28117 RepID=UPI003FD6D5D1
MMEEAVFVGQYTFLVTPQVFEEEERILGKIARRLRCEYVIRFEDDGKFYFLLETRSGYEEHFARCGWYIVSQTDFNSRLTIGMGLYESGHLAGFMYRLDSGSEDEARMWNSILLFTFFHDFRKAFFPLDNRFQGFFRLDGSLCLYLYDYCPVRRNDRITFEGKKISNAVYRFKSGEETDLFVKLFSIAASRIRVIQENRHRAVLIPVPASTRAKHRTRYEAFCRRLSADMGVADGYGAITVAYDRAQYKGTHGNEDRTANLA